MTFDGFSRYQPRPEWYAHDPSGIHGVGHAARVLVWSSLIGQCLQRERRDLDVEVVRWAAVLHDLRRLDDGRDQAHGSRAAAWVRAHRDSVLTHLNAGQIERLRYCCIWHAQPDERAPEMISELACLKDGDALDRVRLGDVQGRFLRTMYSCTLLVHAEALYELSQAESHLGAWESVEHAARRLGLALLDPVKEAASAAARPRCLAC